MTSSQDAISYLNDVTLKTIDDIEKLLLNLPQDGSKCEIQYVRAAKNPNVRGTADVVEPGNFCVKNVPEPISVSPSTRSSNKVSSKPRRRREVEFHSLNSLNKKNGKNSEIDVRIDSDPKKPYKILTDNIKVKPIVSMNGVVLDIDVEITLEKNKKKIVKLEIECPNYTPARIKIEGKWKNIV
ncbi:unnamed protein product [Caenorhabditis angaria]|uniref:Uncharacterized protein n=1 Tax=Caenorhabditis angaria TaxID=860376 RepID=A0A9P1I4R4_9PELO|nr:unnamed protein product [Caenorhabditis angaria]